MIRIKKGDTRHAVEATLSFNGAPEDLTGCQVSFVMSNGVSGAADVVDAVNGEVLYAMQAENTAKTGMFKGEFKVVYPDSRVSYFPNDDYIKIHIASNLEGETNE